MIDQCPLCQSKLPAPFVTRDRSPAMQNALTSTKGEAMASASGELAFCCCAHCGFVVNAAFDESLTAYDQHYENSQHHSAAFSAYIDNLVNRMADGAAPTTRVVEVGCGKGVFLERLVKHLGPGATGIGFDPTYVGPSSTFEGRIQFERRFYDASAAEVPADVIVCRHVIEHVHDPMVMLRSVRAAVTAQPTAQIFFETPCVDWILKHGVTWDFFYEHCSLFSAGSLSYAFEAAGFSVEQVEHVFGGQYLLLKARPAAIATLSAPQKPRQAQHTLDLMRHFSDMSEKQVRRWQDIVSEHSNRCVVWGAGAKGVTLLNLLDPDNRHIAAVVDVNPGKQGRFVPGTGHPCIPPEGISDYSATAVLATNPNYLNEIQSTLETIAPHCRVINLMEHLP